ncbi:PDR/VanB family oxidoreductase [Pseudonocardia sp. WMMC193]|uniref:PDR/VanB family oxidoreductase n=1 Tax=Pseudonocardia sp. WMMC193 TaxID=2911965 RepID=UPI001F17BD67|nr:PDR/VanB family oxidoreductase [Pseudonocardia sp. WMMC193]MCF7549339.1 PDR/VanB family oxidoreductase [Pseudonocardia sp. WMMC193]
MAPTTAETTTPPARATPLAEPLDAVVRERRRVADDVDLFTVDRGGAALPPWSAGAHIDVAAGDGLVRQYSLCGDPRVPDRYEVAVLLDHAGRGGSRRIHDTLHVGSPVTISAPRNNFALVPARRYLFLAGGIGITPMLPMIAQAVSHGADWRLEYGGRRRTSMAFLDRLGEYGHHVRIHPEDETGPLPLDAVLRRVDPDTLVYCCGPEGLLAAVEARCARLPTGTLHVERFRATPGPADGTADRPFTVHFSTSGRSATVAAGQTIVDAAEACGVALPASCFEGVCGTCETRVLAGRPDHRDSLLSPEERASGETILTCVSRSLDDELHLDA